MAKTEAKMYSHFPDVQRRVSRMATHKHKDRNKSSILAILYTKLHMTLKSTLLIMIYLTFDYILETQEAFCILFL